MIDVLAIGAVSPLGAGVQAWSLGAIGAPAACSVREDEVLRAAGLRKPFAARVAIDRGRDPAVTMLLAAYAQIADAIPSGRLGVAIGTSSGGMATAERLFATRAAGVDPTLADAATYHGPFRALLRTMDREVVRATHPVTACSASTIAIGIAMRWLESEQVDVAIAGGYDALTTFVAAGFEALGATTAAPPAKPFRVGRDGMSLGEGAGLFVLVRAGTARDALARIAGFGAAGDAVHLTAPDRTGGGLARAASRALRGIDPREVDLVSVHGTSTPFNDPMESKAIATALGRPIVEVDVHAGKASIGHTLGAAGVLESALAIDALRRGVAPATAGEGELDPEVEARPNVRNEAKPIRAVLKLSAAFGGANAALAIVPADRDVKVAIERRAVREVARVEVRDVLCDVLDPVVEASGVARERLARMDHPCRLALWACGKLAGEVGRERLKGAGIVLGTALATIDVNAVYDEGMRRKGAAFAEGRRFAYTTPNAAAGECAMAFGLTGPNLAVSRGWDAAVEAEEVARDLIAAGDAEAVVVVDVDARGPVAREVAAAVGVDVPWGARARLLERA